MSAHATSSDTPPLLCDPIIIVGAGVFGLSTAIHLAKRGYQDVTVYDRHAYDSSQFSYFRGADSASTDINKIIRSAYGGVSIYQELSLEAIEGWKEWNEKLSKGDDLPPGLKKGDQVFVPNGNLSMTDTLDISEFDRATIVSMEAAGHVGTQLDVTNPRHRKLATEKGFGFAIDPFGRKKRGQANTAVLDTTGGTAIADKACRFALHHARRLGVKFILHPLKGCFEGLAHDPDNGPHVNGIKTRDGLSHPARMTVLACGAWTPSLVPEMDGLCEATAGTVAFIKIPRESRLWDRFSPETFPSWQWNMRNGAGGGLYGFARNEEGWLKIGYRGVKYTNPVSQSDGVQRSVPITRWTPSEEGGKRMTAAPQQALEVIERFLRDYLPELGEAGLEITHTRICWYNDSFDNHLVIDRLPDKSGVMVATGDSGHAFKYLPVLGSKIVDVMEMRESEDDCMQAWKWRSLGSAIPQNVLMEGSAGSRSLWNVPQTAEWSLSGPPKARL
jgi:sarcosine oxidase/L-pipecolate oxidase